MSATYTESPGPRAINAVRDGIGMEVLGPLEEMGSMPPFSFYAKLHLNLRPKAPMKTGGVL